MAAPFMLTSHCPSHFLPSTSHHLILLCLFSWFWGFPGGSDGKETTCNVGDLWSIPGVGRFPWRRAWQPTPAFLPGKSHAQRSLAGYSPWGHKQTDMTEHTCTPIVSFKRYILSSCPLWIKLKLTSNFRPTHLLQSSPSDFHMMALGAIDWYRLASLFY